MARNKYPEETERKILLVSRRLFEEKGYEHTTIQDIVNALGMSKGAVYHHFKSKEDIYDRICDMYYDQLDWFRDLTVLPGKNALEKIRNLFHFLLSDPEKLEMDQLSASLDVNPKLLTLALHSSINDAAPIVIALIEEGNADGSLHVLQPKETAEAFMILMNIWIGIFTTTKEDFLRKMTFLKDFCDHFGMPIIDDAVLGTAAHYYDQVIVKLSKRPT